MPKSNIAATPFIETRFGTKFPFLNPSVDDIDVKDIAFSLANQCRFNGHVPFFSVAEHSVAVAARLPPHLQLAGLLHDAAEAYLSDIPSPIKAYLPDYQEMEERVQKVIYAAFNVVLSDADKTEIKYADKDATHTEAFYLLESQGESWTPVLFQPQEAFAPRCLPPPEAVRMFLHWHKELTTPKPTFEQLLGVM